MAKEFDIYLNERLTQCDIIVYSIPYRDGLTVMNRLILETCLESYTLQKFIAVQSGSVLVSHIDEMIKTCLERLNHGIVIDTSAEFQVHYSLRPNSIALEIEPKPMALQANVFASAENALQLTALPVSAYVKKSFGYGQSGLEIKSDVGATLKRDLEKASNQLEVFADSLSMKKRVFEQAESSVAIDTEMTDLLYRVYGASSMGIEIAAQALETEIHFSLGRSTFPIELDSQVLGEQMTKFAALEGTVGILVSVAESLTQFMVPSATAFEIESEAEAIVKRHRLLYEMDADALSTYDDMSLNDVDYVIL